MDCSISLDAKPTSYLSLYTYISVFTVSVLKQLTPGTEAITVCELDLLCAMKNDVLPHEAYDIPKVVGIQADTGSADECTPGKF